MNKVITKSTSTLLTTIIALAGAAIATANADTLIDGTVTNAAGAPLAGAMIRLTNPSIGMSETIYADREGRYTLQTQLKGELRFRVRAPYYADFTESLTLKQDSKLQKKVSLEKLKSDHDISESLAAAYHFNALPFDKNKGEPFTRDQFQLECLSCHQIGNQFTRTVRPAKSWEQSVQRMHAYMGAASVTEKDKRRSEILAAGFTGAPTKLRPRFSYDDALTHTKVTEYQLPSSGVPHDALIHSRTGRAYTVDQFTDGMYVTDFKTSSSKFIPHPKQGYPLGGKFTQMGVPPAMNKVSVRHGPHSLAEGLDGKLYTTNSFSGSIGIFNVETNSWEASVPLPGHAIYPHTIRVDKKGILWFSVVGTEQVGRLDPTTQAVTLIDLPTPRPVTVTPAVLTYGVAVSSVDSSVWYSRLWGNKIGRINPTTLKVTEYESPVAGPRRLRFNKDGTLWLAGYAHGQLAKIDISTMRSKVYDLPEFAPGARPAPYSLGIAPDTGDVWINETMTDSIYRFIPSEERFVAYPAPLRGTYTRDMSFTKDGNVCMTNNPIPVQSLEEYTGVLMCIDPNYAP